MIAVSRSRSWGAICRGIGLGLCFRTRVDRLLGILARLRHAKLVVEVCLSSCLDLFLSKFLQH
jgi:hypothetical protein